MEIENIADLLFVRPQQLFKLTIPTESFSLMLRTGVSLKENGRLKKLARKIHLKRKRKNQTWWIIKGSILYSIDKRWEMDHQMRESLCSSHYENNHDFLKSVATSEY